MTICIPLDSCPLDACNISNDLPNLTLGKKKDESDTVSVDEMIDEELSDEEIDEWDDEKIPEAKEAPGEVHQLRSTDIPDDLRINETKITDSGYVCSRV